MDPFFESIYVVELLAQRRASRSALARFNAALSAHLSGDVARERIAEVFDAAAHFLQHAANMSKILWSPDERRNPAAKIRGAHLRQVLEVHDGRAVRDRDLRDHLEHYDVRLDQWAAATRKRRIVDGHIGPKSAIQSFPFPVDDTDIMRMYDPATGTYTFRGRAFHFQAIESALAEIETKAATRLELLDPHLFADLRGARLI